MAWRAYLAEPVVKATGSTRIQVIVWYYDDADAANASVGPGPPPVPPAGNKILHSAAQFFDGGATRQEIQDWVRREGAAARSAATNAATINSQYVVGSTIAIP